MAAPGFPTPLQRLRYSFGGALPEHRDWVRHDLTDTGWRWRAMGRVLAQVLPFAVALGLLPGPAYLHVMLPLFLLLTSGFTAAAYADDLRARRLRQHGLPPVGRRTGGAGDEPRAPAA